MGLGWVVVCVGVVLFFVNSPLLWAKFCEELGFNSPTS